MLIVCFSCQKEKPREVEVKAKPTGRNDMPAFNFTQIDGAKVAFKEVTGKVLIVFFNPGCDHCQREAKLLSENKDIIKDYHVYFISPEPLDSIAKFSVDYNMVEPNVHFGRGEGADIVNAVGPITTVPTFMLYEDQTFIGRMEGEISLDKLKQMLK